MWWWIGDPSRLQNERRAIAEINDGWFENPEWSLDEQRRLRLIFDIVLPHRGFKLSMAYHNTFPASPPSIHPVGETEISDFRPSVRRRRRTLPVDPKRQLEPGHHGCRHDP